MPSPKIPEGFYWVRLDGDSAPTVAHRFAGCWWTPGVEGPPHGNRVEVLSARIEPPVTDLQGRAILAHLMPKPAHPKVPRSRRTATP